MSVPATQRRIIEDIFELYGRDIAMRSDEHAHPTRLSVDGEYGERPVLRGRPELIAFAIDVRDKVFVPECWDEEASTWA